MGIFGSLFDLKKPYFIFGNEDKLAIPEVAKILIGLSTEEHQKLGEAIIELIPEELLTQKIKSSKPLNMLILSFQLAVHLQAIAINSEIPDAYLIKLKNELINEAKELTHRHQKIYQEEDMAYIEQFTINYYDRFNEYFNQHVFGTLMPEGPGSTLIDDVVKIYELPSDIISQVDRMLFSTIVLERSSQSIQSFSDGTIKWVS